MNCLAYKLQTLMLACTLHKLSYFVLVTSLRATGQLVLEFIKFYGHLIKFILQLCVSTILSIKLFFITCPLFKTCDSSKSTMRVFSNILFLQFQLYLRSSSTGVGVDVCCGEGLATAFGVSEVSPIVL